MHYPLPLMTRRCRDCGAPHYAHSSRSWNDDGTITAWWARDLRVCQLETGALAAVFDGISNRIGYPIDLIAVQGQRKAMRRATEMYFSLYHGLPGKLCSRGPLSRFIGERLSVGVAWTLGHARCESVEHVPGKHYEVTMFKPYSWQLMVGDIWGGFEALHNVTADVQYAWNGDRITIRVEKVGDGMVWQEPMRFNVDRPALVKHASQCARCARCGLPLDVSRNTVWDLEQGMVFNGVTGQREATVIVDVLVATLREIESELGEEIPEMVREITTDRTAACISERACEEMRAAGYRSSLEFMRINGMGLAASVETSGRALTVRVDNPYSGVLTAGMIGGMYKAIEQTEPRVWWVLDPKGYVLVEVNPA